MILSNLNRFMSRFLLLAIFAFKATCALSEKNAKAKSSQRPPHLSYTQFRSILSFNDDELFGQQQQQQQKQQQQKDEFISVDDLWNNMISDARAKNQQDDAISFSSSFSVSSLTTNNNYNDTNNLQNTTKDNTLLFPFIVCHLDYDSSLYGAQRHDIINSVLLNKSNSSSDFFLEQLPIFNHNYDNEDIYTQKKTNKDKGESTENKYRKKDEEKAYGACFQASMNFALTESITKDDGIVITPLACALKIRRDHSHWNVNKKDREDNTDSVDNNTVAIAVSIAPGMVKSEIELMELADNFIDLEGEKKDKLKSKLVGACDDSFLSLLSVVVTGLTSFSYEVQKRRSSMQNITHKCYRSFVEYLSLQREIQSIERVPKTFLLDDITNWILQSGEEDKNPWLDLGITGKGETVHVVDSGLDLNSCYFRDANGQVPLTTSYNVIRKIDHNKRKVLQYVALDGFGDDVDGTGHGTHVVSILLGKRSDDGRIEVDGYADGVAPGAKVAFFDANFEGDESFNILIILNLFFYFGKMANARISNASWGFGIHDQYTSRARDVDKYFYEHDKMLMVAAAGNDGGNGNTTIFDPAVSKNVLAIGASHSYGKNLQAGMLDFNYVAWFSSRGPTGDERIKPDLIAPGHSVLSARANSNECDPPERPQFNGIFNLTYAGLTFMSGTSMACPSAAGAGALVRQYFKEIYWPPMDISGTLLKAVLINGAQPLLGRATSVYGGDGYVPSVPYDQYQGFGMINLMKSLKHPKIDDSPDLYVKDMMVIAQGEVHEYEFDLCDVREFRITIVWNDPPGVMGCSHCLINDLDLEVEYGGVQYYPNGRVSRDDRNNVERVVLTEEVLGSTNSLDSVVLVTVRANNIGYEDDKSQKYSLASTGCINEVRSHEARFDLLFNITYPTTSQSDVVTMVDEAQVIENAVTQIFNKNIPFSRLLVLHQYISDLSCTIMFKVTSKLYTCDDLCTDDEFTYFVGNTLTNLIEGDDFLDTLNKLSFAIDGLSDLSSTDIEIDFDFTFGESLSPSISNEPTGTSLSIEAPISANSQCGSDEFQYYIEINTDKRPEETSWILQDEISGKILDSVLLGQYDEMLQKYEHHGCALNSCFTFTIYDLYRNGMCCDKGEGFYNVFANDELKAAGREFESHETTPFCYNPPTNTPTSSSAPSDSSLPSYIPGQELSNTNETETLLYLLFDGIGGIIRQIHIVSLSFSWLLQKQKDNLLKWLGITFTSDDMLERNSTPKKLDRKSNRFTSEVQTLTPHLSFAQFSSILSFNGDEYFEQQQELISAMSVEEIWNNMISDAWTSAQHIESQNISLPASLFTTTKISLHPFIVCHLDYESSLCGTQRYDYINSVLLDKSNSSTDFFLDKLPIFNHNYGKVNVEKKKKRDIHKGEAKDSNISDNMDDERAYGACFYASMNVALTESITEDDGIVITPLASVLKIHRDHSHWNDNKKDIKNNTDSVDKNTVAIAVSVAPGMVTSELEVMELAHDLINTEGDRKDELLSKLVGACDDSFLSLISVVVTGLNSFSYKIERSSMQNITYVCYKSFVEYLSLQRYILSIEKVSRTEQMNDNSQWIIQSGQENERAWSDLGLSGRGEIVQVLDTGLDENSCYFRDAEGQVPLTTDLDPISKIDHNKRKVIQYVQLQGIGDGIDNNGGHGTHVVGTILGKRSDDGRIEVDGYADGVAPGAKVAFFDANIFFEDVESLDVPLDIRSLFSYAEESNARIHSASWGKNRTQHTDQMVQIDKYLYEFNNFAVFAGAGNDGEDGNTTIIDPGFSKNVISVGASHSHGKNLQAGMLDFNYLASFSSRGPTFDGRIKPDLIAPGHSVLSARANSNECDPPERPQYDPDDKHNAGLTFKSGTSMACPSAAAAGTLVRQYFKEIYWPPMDISGTLLKAVLINGAQPLLGRATSVFGDGYVPSVPYDQYQGFGMINLMKSLKHPKIDDSPDLYVKDMMVIAQGEVHEYEFDLCDDREFRITIVWNDPPGTKGCMKCLINDLDLEVEYGGVQYYPNGGRYKDDKNNVERVVLTEEDLSSSGTNKVISVTVRASNMGYGNYQKYSLASTGCINNVLSSVETVSLSLNISYTTASYPDAVYMFDEAKAVKDTLHEVFRGDRVISRLDIEHQYCLDPKCTIIFNITSNVDACVGLCDKNEIINDFSGIIGTLLDDAYNNGEFVDTLVKKGVFMEAFDGISVSDIDVEYGFSFDRTTLSPTTLSPTTPRPTSIFPSTSPSTSNPTSFSFSCDNDSEYVIDVTSIGYMSWTLEKYDNREVIETETYYTDYDYYGISLSLGCVQEGCFLFTINPMLYSWRKTYTIRIENKTVAEGSGFFLQKKREYFCYYDITDDGNIIQTGVLVIFQEVVKIIQKTVGLFRSLIDYFMNNSISDTVSDVVYESQEWMFYFFQPWGYRGQRFRYGVIVTTDDQPEETSWQLSYYNGTLIDSIEEGQYDKCDKAYANFYCLGIGCYNFSIFGGADYTIRVGNNLITKDKENLDYNKGSLFCFDGDVLSTCQDRDFQLDLSIVTYLTTETYWELSYDNGILIDQGNYTVSDSYMDHYYSFSVNPGCFVFNIDRGYNDKASYSLKIGDHVVAEGYGVFGYNETKLFCFNCTLNHWEI